jgi:hypothetical protein
VTPAPTAAPVVAPLAQLHGQPHTNNTHQWRFQQARRAQASMRGLELVRPHHQNHQLARALVHTHRQRAGAGIVAVEAHHAAALRSARPCHRTLGGPTASPTDMSRAPANGDHAHVPLSIHSRGASCLPATRLRAPSSTTLSRSVSPLRPGRVGCGGGRELQRPRTTDNSRSRCSVYLP